MENKDSKEKKLTIVITTYNRRQSLLEQLQSIECQGQYDKFNIIISNNNSNYNVDDWLKSKLSSEFMRIIEIYNRPYNVGGDVNIAFTFQLVKTHWMWLLSDDDITISTSISTILNDINKKGNEDICWIKYSIEGKSLKHFDDTAITSLTSLFDYFSSRDHTSGELIFMSNNIYNLNLLYEYLGYAPLYSDTCISQLIPPFFAIKNENKTMLLSSKSIIEYTSGNDSYTRLYVQARFGNLLYSGLNMNKTEIKSFKKLKFTSVKSLIYDLTLLENKTLRHEYFKKIFISYYSLNSCKGLMFLLLYFITRVLFINQNSMKILKAIYSLRTKQRSY